MSLQYIPVTQSILCLIFLMFIRTIQHLNYSGQESEKQFAVCDSDTSVNLKQNQDHQTWHEFVEPKQSFIM